MNEIEKYRQNFYRWLVSGVLPQTLWRTSLDKESKDRINGINDLVHNQRQDLSVVVYFNHISTIDPLFAGNIAFWIDKKWAKKLVAPMSFSNTEEKEENKSNLLMKKIVEKCGIETHRVIQSYQIDNPEYGYSKIEAYRQNKPFLHRLKDLGEQKIPTLMIISPEGHRTDGALIKAEEGMVVGGSLLAPTLFVPVGIEYRGEIKKDGLNLFKRVNLNIGETYLLEPNTNNKEVFGILMRNLANSLPVEMRGYYRESLTDVPRSR